MREEAERRLAEASEKEKENAGRRGAVERQKREVEATRRTLEAKQQDVVRASGESDAKNQLRVDLEDQAALYASEKKRLAERLAEQEVATTTYNEA